MIDRLSHVAIAVPDLEEAISRFRDAYGITVSEVHTNEQQQVRLVYLELGNCRIELLAPAGPSSPLHRFLQRNPKGGLHHLCFGTDDLEGSLRRIVESEGIPIRPGRQQVNHAGVPIAFIHPDTAGNTLVELEGPAGSGPGR